MVMAHDGGDLGVRVDVRQDSLTNLGVKLHLSSFLQRERARLLQQASRKTDLADVMNESADIGELLLLRA